MLLLEEGERADEIDEFSALFAAHQRSVYQLAFLLCGDRSLAEEATAEVFAKVYRRWDRARPDDPGAYLRRAVVNQVRGRFRRLRLERANSDRRSGDDRGARPFEDWSADRDELRRALMVLPPKQRAAIVLRYFEDLPEAEVADVLGISVGTVKGYVSRGLDRLRQLLDEEDSL